MSTSNPKLLNAVSEIEKAVKHLGNAQLEVETASVTGLGYYAVTLNNIQTMLRNMTPYLRYEDHRR